jgi:DNA-binding GntR family transcriptional regulator
MSKQNNVYKNAYNRALDLLKSVTSLPTEPELGEKLGISRTTVRAILTKMHDDGLLAWNKREKSVLRRPVQSDYFTELETDSTATIIERAFMQKMLGEGVKAGLQINELELAREIGVGTTSIREFLIRFSRFGLIEKRQNSHWILKGLTQDYALELTEVRELFEIRSASAFVDLPKDNPVWQQLSDLRVEHVSLLQDIESRFLLFSELDERFHRFLHSAVPNRFIGDFYDIIAMVFHYHYQWNKRDQVSRNKLAVIEHIAYIDALISGDKNQALLACKVHLNSARTTLFRSLE